MMKALMWHSYVNNFLQENLDAPNTEIGRVCPVQIL